MYSGNIHLFTFKIGIKVALREEDKEIRTRRDKR